MAELHLKNRYLATRDPSKGGLHIADTSEGFPKDCLQYIYHNCLELVTTGPCEACMVKPMGDGRFVIAMARKVKESEVESRPHQMIRGFVVEEGEFEIVCKCMSQPWFETLFFETNQSGSFREFVVTDEMKAFQTKNEDSETELCNALMELAHSKKKVQLLVPKGRERMVQALCYSVLPDKYKNHLSIISNGECTMMDADILITDKIIYQNSRKYIPMTWEAFLEKGKKVREEEKIHTSVADKAVAACMEYLEDPMIPKNQIYMIRDKMFSQPEEVHKEFQMKLRCHLENLVVEEEAFEDYVQVMCLAFENYQGKCTEFKKNMLPIPYDISELMDFIKLRTMSKREMNKYIEQIVELQLECYQFFISQSKVKRVIKKER